jgi:hypothetical protein
MNPKDTVKFTIYSKTAGNIGLVTSRENATTFDEEVTGNQNISGWYKISGRLNDVDCNAITLTLYHEDIAGFDIVETNQKF